MSRHQYGISAVVSQTSFRGETGGGVVECVLFSQAISAALGLISRYSVFWCEDSEVNFVAILAFQLIWSPIGWNLVNLFLCGVMFIFAF